MRKGTVLLLMLALSARSAFAQNADGLTARQAAVNELFAARQEDKIIDALVSTLARDYVSRLRQLHPEMTQDHLDALQTAMVKNLTATKSTYLAAEAKLLSEKMTLKDLNAVIVFYKTDAGKRIADITAALIPDSGKNQIARTGAAVSKATNELNSAAKVSK